MNLTLLLSLLVLINHDPLPLSAENEKMPTSITYTLSGGRLGDNLIAYMHAKWLSYVFNIPMLYVPFEYSKQLALEQIEDPYYKGIEQKFDAVIYVKNEHSIDRNDKRSILYKVDYFPECKWESKRLPHLPSYDVDWEDKPFRQMLREAIQRTTRYIPRVIPKDQISVAVHMRMGGGVDPKGYFFALPLKFPPLSFYIDQVKRLYKLYKKKAMYIYIFTDHLNPLELLEQFREAIPEKNITFECRTADNKPNRWVLIDFFEMTKFDCLIRPESNFSIAAEKIAEHQVVISPKTFIKKDQEVIIDQVNLNIRDPKLKLLHK